MNKREYFTKFVEAYGFTDVKWEWESYNYHSGYIPSEKKMVIGLKNVAKCSVLASILHEYGHHKTTTTWYINNYMACYFYGTNKWVLLAELKASAWACRWVKKNKPEYYDDVKSVLRRFYSTYRVNYSPELNDVLK